MADGPHSEGPVIVFDSGVGGLSVLDAIRETPHGRRLVYVADDAAFPYGNWEEALLRDHIVGLMGRLIDQYRPEAVVIACNTASTIVLDELRRRHSLPFVGTVPAIKPAAETTRSNVIGVLATPGTMRREYTRTLIRDFASGCDVRLVGAPLLAAMAEAEMEGRPASDADLREQIAPAFVEVDGRRTDTVVLGCTHYPFLVERMDRIAPWPVAWIDPAPAIARRLLAVIGARDGDGTGLDGGDIVGRLTSGRVSPPTLRAVYAAHGVTLRDHPPA